MEVELGKRQHVEVKITNVTPMNISRGDKKRRQEIEEGEIKKITYQRLGLGNPRIV